MKPEFAAFTILASQSDDLENSGIAHASREVVKGGVSEWRAVTAT